MWICSPTIDCRRNLFVAGKQSSMTSIKKRRITSRLLTNVCTLALSCSFFCFFCLRRYHGVVLRSSVFSSSIFPHAFSFVAPNSFLLVDRRSTYSCHIVLLMDPWLDLYVSTWQSSHKVSTLGISRSYRMLVSSLVTDWWCRRKRYMHNSGFHSGSLCCCIIPLYRSTVVTCNFSIYFSQFSLLRQVLSALLLLCLDRM
jgi:hypothetical protein